MSVKSVTEPNAMALIRLLNPEGESVELDELFGHPTGCKQCILIACVHTLNTRVWIHKHGRRAPGFTRLAHQYRAEYRGRPWVRQGVKLLCARAADTLKSYGAEYFCSELRRRPDMRSSYFGSKVSAAELDKAHKELEAEAEADRAAFENAWKKLAACYYLWSVKHRWKCELQLVEALLFCWPPPERHNPKDYCPVGIFEEMLPFAEGVDLEAEIGKGPTGCHIVKLG